jgi:hypothetical protein
LDPLALFIVPLFNFIHLYSATFRHNDAKIYILLSGGGTIGHAAPARNILGGLDTWRSVRSSVYFATDFAVGVFLETILRKVRRSGRPVAAKPLGP